MTLRNRMFLATALVAAISVLSALPIVSVRATREAEADLRRGLDAAARLVGTRHAARLETSRVMARLVADLPKLKAAVATADPPTVEPVAREYRAQVGAHALVVTDARGVPLAGTGLDAEAMRGTAAVSEALAGRESAMFLARPSGLLEVVAAPIAIGPEILGTLCLGFLLDDALAADLKAATESEVVLGTRSRVLASTLPRSLDGALLPLLGAPRPDAVALGEEEYVVRTLPLAAQGAHDAPVALVLRSRTARLLVLRTFRMALLAAGVLGLAFAVGLSYAVARTVTGPMSAVTAAMREISATGDLARKVRLDPGWGDADARLLAATLDSLTEALARFQAEAAMRERLSALGRMATVVAHEVRNPLLVVKASLRTLRRPEAAREEIAEALGDIDAEVARLNRIVNDVLDFTRPVRVELAPADLVQVCKDAAVGLARQGEGAAVRVRAAEAAPVETDAERLRAALTNVLVNAREAVLAARREDGGAPLPDVDLRVERAGADRYAIEVEDRGVGLPEEDVARVFEPYFTTKRAGSGLGLAIARNVVESLGGTIALRSRPGAGTVVRIEIPARPGRGRKDAA